LYKTLNIHKKREGKEEKGKNKLKTNKEREMNWKKMRLRRFYGDKKRSNKRQKRRSSKDK
jgi:hypothetical protein